MTEEKKEEIEIDGTKIEVTYADMGEEGVIVLDIKEKEDKK